MWIKKEYDFYDLQDNCYGSAKDVLRMISDVDLEDDFMSILDEVFEDNENNPPEFMYVNDFISSEEELITNMLGLDEDDE